jgi:hypothetical protein
MTGVAAQVPLEDRATDWGCARVVRGPDRPLPVPAGPAVNALTVDLEDWYHVCGTGETVSPLHWDAYESRVTRSTHTILSLLGRRGVRATFFVLGYVAEREPELIRAIAREGHEVPPNQPSPIFGRLRGLGRSPDPGCALAALCSVVGYRRPIVDPSPHHGRFLFAETESSTTPAWSADPWGPIYACPAGSRDTAHCGVSLDHRPLLRGEPAVYGGPPHAIGSLLLYPVGDPTFE